MNHQQKYKKKIRRMHLSGLAGLLSASIIGCLSGGVTPQHKVGNFRNFEVTVDIDRFGPREIKLEDKTTMYRETYLIAYDRSLGRYPDGRFDTIALAFVPKGHRLERYANVDSLELAYQTVMDQANVAEAESRSR